MKKRIISMVTLCLLGLSACGNVSNSTSSSSSLNGVNSSSSSVSSAGSTSTNSSKNDSSSLDVLDIDIVKYQESINLGEKYNESSVELKVIFSDGSFKLYKGNDLTFNYDEFNYNQLGVQTIRVLIIELNKTIDLKVEVKKETFKLLMISNSFGDDTVQWVHEICEDLEIDFTIANLYIGGCNLQNHLTNLTNNSSNYEYVTYNKTNKTWSRQAHTSISDALLSEDWNYVSLQQGSTESGLSDTYSTINQVMDKVLEIKNDVKFIWNMTWAYQQNSGHVNFGNYNNDQMTMYNAILDAVQKNILNNNRFELIVPNGTAIQNARTSFIGDNLCRDAYCHLTYDLGRYIAGLTMVGALTGEDISQVEYTPGLSENKKLVAIEAVNNALNKPFEVTQSMYTDNSVESEINIFEGKTFIPTEDALNAVFPPWNSDVYFGYETLTDGKMAELEGRFSSKFDGFACATIDLDGNYTLNELRFYDYKQDAEYMGSSLIIEVYANEEWKTIVNCETNAEIANHRVSLGAGDGSGWINFELDSIEAEQVRFTIPSTHNGKTISIYEIMCYGTLN